jgi:hypothetical protein
LLFDPAEKTGVVLRSLPCQPALHAPDGTYVKSGFGSPPSGFHTTACKKFRQTIFTFLQNKKVPDAVPAAVQKIGRPAG